MAGEHKKKGMMSDAIVMTLTWLVNEENPQLMRIPFPIPPCPY